MLDGSEVSIKKIIQNKEKIKTRVFTVYEYLKKVEDLYERMPFKELQEKEEYAPLLFTKKILSEVRKMIDNAMADHDTLFGDLIIVDYCKSLITLGHLHHISLKNLLKDISSHPESKNFQILDGDGKVLNIC